MGLACDFGPSSGVILLVGLLQYLWFLRELPGGDGAVCHRYFCWLRPPPPINSFVSCFPACVSSYVVYGLCPVHLVPGSAPTTLPCCCCRGITDVTPVLGSSPWVTVFPA